MKVTRTETSVTLSLHGLSVSINPLHHSKLLLSHSNFRPAPSFPYDAFALLARYDALGGAGLQAAVPGPVLDSLRAVADVRMECFASPLNCRYGPHCSAFEDTDAAFGSLGSFFDFRPVEGSYEANPPFVPSFISRMRAHMDELLSATSSPLSFCVVVPEWKADEGWAELCRSRHLVRRVSVPQREHVYQEGTAYRRRAEARVASFDTTIFWLQNEAGRVRYGQDGGDAVLEAFGGGSRGGRGAREGRGVGRLRRHESTRAAEILRSCAR